MWRGVVAPEPAQYNLRGGRGGRSTFLYTASRRRECARAHPRWGNVRVSARMVRTTVPINESQQAANSACHACLFYLATTTQVQHFLRTHCTAAITRPAHVGPLDSITAVSAISSHDSEMGHEHSFYLGQNYALHIGRGKTEQ